MFRMNLKSFRMTFYKFSIFPYQFGFGHPIHVSIHVGRVPEIYGRVPEIYSRVPEIYSRVPEVISRVPE